MENMKKLMTIFTRNHEESMELFDRKMMPGGMLLPTS